MQGGMAHGIAVSPEVAKRVLWACLTMPVAALALRLHVDPVHQAHTHHAAELPMPPHVPPPVADLSEQQLSADSS